MAPIGDNLGLGLSSPLHVPHERARTIQAEEIAWVAVYRPADAREGSRGHILTPVLEPRQGWLADPQPSGHFDLSQLRLRALGQPESQTTTYERQAGTNRQTARIDALGRRTEYAYDAKGNLASITRLAGTPNAVTTSFTYDPTFSQVTTVTDPLNHTTSFGYDPKGALTSITDPLQHQTVITPDATGQPASIQDPLNQTTQFTYETGDLVATTDPLGRTTTRFLDAVGRVLQVTDPLGRATAYTYDRLNRLTTVTDAQGGTTTFAYDPNGNLLSVTDAASRQTTYVYNSMDRLITRTDPLTHAESYQYDATGNLTQVTDRKSQVTTFTYDGLNRRTVTTYPGPTPVTATYDAGNRVTQLMDAAAGTINRTFDGLDRLTQETTPQGTVSYSYDPAGRRATMTVAGQSAVTYTFDAADRLTQVAQSSQTVGLAYDTANRRTSLTLPNGIVIESAYDTASRLTGLTYKLGAATLGALTYTPDPAGNRTAVGGTWARTGLPAAVATTSYNANHQQLTFGGTTMTYDLNGNLATLTDTGGTTTHTWNARNQLTGLSGPGLTASFGYDALGRRWTKTVNAAQADVLYDGLNPVQEGVLPSTPAANLLTGLGLDERFTRTDGAGLRAFLADALGSAVALADGAGAVQTEYTYVPFGETTASGQTSANPHQFTGRENDGTGLYSYRARYYSPGLGRFLSEDPVEFAFGEFNLYGYVRENPVRYSDPYGLFLGFPSPEEHFGRNRFNRCPWRPPDGSKSAGGPWRQDPIYGAAGVSKYRGADGSECIYIGGTLTGGGTFNYGGGNFPYWPPTRTVPHVWKDVLPHFIYGGDYYAYPDQYGP